MTKPLRERAARPLAAALLLTASALVGTTLAQAEVVGAKTPASKETSPVIHEEPVSLECWQKGRRIIMRDGLSGLAVKAVTRKGAVAFKQLDSDQPEIFLLPFEDSLCLVGPK